MESSDRNGRRPNHTRTYTKRIFLGVCIISAIAFIWQRTFAGGTAVQASNSPAQPVAANLSKASLRAASGASILFMTQNNTTIHNVPPQREDIPHLVLSRNSELANPEERTLIVTIGDLDVPPGGITATLRLETQHGDPDLGGGDGSRITVWQGSRRIDNSQDTPLSGQSASFNIEFSDTFSPAARPIPTPSDYYRYDVEITGGSDPASQTLESFSQDYAFLLERQWAAPLQGIIGSVGPRELVVSYCDMFPFQKSAHDPATRIPRRDIPGYIQNELGPQMLDAIRLQTQDWGFSLEGWSSAGHDSLTVALSEGETWFHGPAPQRGHSGISINVNGGDNADYDTLTEGLMSTFQHELFHIFQHSLVLSNGGDGDFNGKDAAWQFFSEGTASFASSAAQTDIQFSQSGEARAYIEKAIEFVGGRGFPGDLNKSYAEMDPYHAALYWRFLYEQCGGMPVIRHSLQVLYGKEVLDFSQSSALVQALPAILDRTLASPEASACPFRTYRESLVDFARAVYELRLEGGRCSAPGSPAGCGFYDPNHVYSTPRTETITYLGNEAELSGKNQPYPPGIRSSFGMDFIDIALNAKAQGQPLTIEVYGGPSGKAEFSVQLLHVLERGSGFSSQTSLVGSFPVETLESGSADGHLTLTLPAVDIGQFNRLGVIITRVDANESLDPVGAYTLVVRPGN